MVEVSNEYQFDCKRLSIFQEMRKKVAEMMNLLAQRRNKLKVTNEVIDKKSDVVEKVKEEKILTAKVLDRKERRANYLTKQREEQIAFGKKQAKK